MKNIIYISFSCLLAIALSTCKKDISPVDAYADYTTYNIPQDFKDYFYFSQGSYWIYQNQKNGDLDSVYIVDRSSRHVYDASRKLRMESILVHYYDSFYGVLFETNTDICSSCIDSLQKARYVLELAAKSGFPTGGGDYACVYPLRKGNKIYQNYYTLDVVEDNDTFFYNQIQYTNVAKLYSKRNILFNEHQVNVYYLKDFGIVRKTDLTTNDDWVMVRCNIIK